MLILTQKHNKYGNSPDAEFMEKCAEIDHHRPETWAKYQSGTVVGANEIIAMEYNELMSAAKNGNMKLWEENIFHLSVALLNAWRSYESTKSDK